MLSGRRGGGREEGCVTGAGNRRKHESGTNHGLFPGVL